MRALINSLRDGAHKASAKGGLWDALKSLFTGPDLIREAEDRRAEIMRRRDEAYARGDTREFGRARMELRQATHDALVQQVWK